MAMLRGGIDLGGTKIQAVVIDGRGHVIGQSRHATPTVGGPPAVIAELADAIGDAAAHARNLPEWIGPYPVARELSRAIRVPVAIGNDVQVATDAEFHLGAGRP